MNKKYYGILIAFIILFAGLNSIVFFNHTEKYSATKSSAAGTVVPKLQWSPPQLSNPVTMILGTGYTNLTLDNTKDYLIQLPASKVNGNIALNGGHNIVIKGGYVSVPSSATSTQQHAFRLSGQTGTIHIEGVLIDASNLGEEDCFYLDTPDAIIQIENVRCLGIPGTANTNHSDIVQFHGGHKEVRIDRLTGSSYYQGLFIGEHNAPGKFGPIFVQNANLSALGDHHQTLLWMASADHNYLMGYTISFTNVWLQPGPTTNTIYDGINGLVLPTNTAVSPWKMVIANGNQLTWPSIPDKVHGFASAGTPASDFVPDGSVGLQYVSPGYASSLVPSSVCLGSCLISPSVPVSPVASNPVPSIQTSGVPSVIPSRILNAQPSSSPGGSIPLGNGLVQKLLEFIVFLLQLLGRLFIHR